MTFQISTDVKQEVKLPVGEGFPRTGIIALWKATVGWEIGWTETNLQQEVEDVAAGLGSEVEEFLPKLIGSNNSPYDHVMVSRAGDKFNYFYADEGLAQTCCELLDRKDPRDWGWRPQQVWRLSAPLSSAQINEEFKSRFSDPLTMTVTMTTLRSKKRRHEYHLMALPAFVNTYAVAQGLETPGFDLGALLVPDDKLIINDEVQARLVGNGDIGYAESSLWLQRAALWKALGENEAERSHTISAATKLSTTSVALNNLLLPTVTPWQAGYWARIVSVPDPRVDAAYGEGDDRTRPGVPCLTEFFADEAAAKAAAEKERGTSEEKTAAVASQPPLATAATASASVDGRPLAPGVWEPYPDNWMAMAGQLKKDLIAKLGTDPATVPPPVLANAVAETIAETEAEKDWEVGATADEVIAWLPYV